MKLIVSLIAILLSTQVFAQEAKLVPDGFPAGHSTPEGVACDAVRAYITSDHKLWLSLILPSDYYGARCTPEGLKGINEYDKFVKMMVEKKKQNANDPNFPKMNIVKVYKARDFSSNTQRSLSYAMDEFIGNMFVDLVISTNDGGCSRLRYHVMQHKNKKWYFDPRPDLIFKFWVAGLNEEPESTIEWGQHTSDGNSEFQIKFGIVTKGCPDYFVSNETTTIPLKVKSTGFHWGFTVMGNKNEKFTSSFIIYLPKSQEIISKDNKKNASLKQDGRVIKSKPVTSTGSYAYPFYFDEGDPAGQWKIEIFVNNTLKKTLNFRVVSTH